MERRNEFGLGNAAFGLASRGVGGQGTGEIPGGSGRRSRAGAKARPRVPCLLAPLGDGCRLAWTIAIRSRDCSGHPRLAGVGFEGDASTAAGLGASITSGSQLPCCRNASLLLPPQEPRRRRPDRTCAGSCRLHLPSAADAVGYGVLTLRSVPLASNRPPVSPLRLTAASGPADTFSRPREATPWRRGRGTVLFWIVPGR